MTRLRLAILVIVAVAFVIVVWSAVRVASGSQWVHDEGTLPNRISACGRDWTRGLVTDGHSLAKERLGRGPILVDPFPLAPCPSDLCTDKVVTLPCETVAYVRVGDDTYVSYALSGGP